MCNPAKSASQLAVYISLLVRPVHGRTQLAREYTSPGQVKLWQLVSGKYKLVLKADETNYPCPHVTVQELVSRQTRDRLPVRLFQAPTRARWVEAARVRPPAE
jgi:hypothetical protein